jgi:hypothetical protein
MLERYKAPEDQGRIYYQLAFIHAQTGVQSPARLLTYCTEALRRPLPPADRLQLYIFGGDAHRLMNKMLPKNEQRSFEQIRRNATAMYLRGLAESQKYNIPEKKPEWEARRDISGPLVTAKSLDDPQVKQEAARRQKANEKYEQEREQFRQDEKAWENRRILFHQIIDMYWRGRGADNFEEMRKVASEALPPEMVAKLFEMKKERVKFLESTLAPVK